MTIRQDIATLDAQAIIEMFSIDLPVYGTLRFHPGVNEKGLPLVFQGNTYNPLPLAAEGFDRASTGTLPRPKLRISNHGGLIAAVLREIDDALGCRVTRQRTFKKYLDAVNFVNGNPTADPGQEFPQEIWYMARRALESPEYVEMELASPWDVMGTRLPRRQIMASICPFQYRGDGCNYTGGPVADSVDNPTSDPARDQCSKSLNGCKYRFGAYGPLPFGGFPASLLLRS